MGVLVAVSTLTPPRAWAQSKARDMVTETVTQEILLQATGPEGGRLEGECVVKTAAGERRLAISRTLPFEERFTGVGLRCRLTATGAAVIEVRAAGNVSRTRTSGGTVSLSIGA